MKFCERHDAYTRAALEVRGLAALIDDNEERMLLSIADVEQCGLSFDNFNPYALVVSDVFHGVMHLYGAEAIELMLTEDLGYETCPICFLDKNCTHGHPTHGLDHSTVLQYAADRQVRNWRRITAQ